MNILQIYEIEDNDIEGLMDKVNRGDFYKQYSNFHQLKNSQTMYFDINNRYLACYGQHCVNIIPLSGGKQD